MRLNPATIRVGPLLILAALAGCGAGREVTERSLKDARSAWKSANIRNYDLEWTSSGAQTGHYVVYVREGTVRAVEQMVRDRRDGRVRAIAAKPGNMTYYGIDGLFKILEDERLQLREPAPFGQPKGAAIVLKFVPDPKLGYPKWYRRDVAGSPSGLAIDVLRFVPDPPAPIPQPSS